MKAIILQKEGSAMGAGVLLIILLTPWWVWLIIGVVAIILITFWIMRKRKEPKTKMTS